MKRQVTKIKRRLILRLTDKDWVLSTEAAKNDYERETLTQLVASRQVKVEFRSTGVWVMLAATRWQDVTSLREEMENDLVMVGDEWVLAWDIVPQGSTATRAIRAMVESEMIEKRGGVGRQPVEIRRHPDLFKRWKS